MLAIIGMIIGVVNLFRGAKLFATAIQMKDEKDVKLDLIFAAVFSFIGIWIIQNSMEIYHYIINHNMNLFF